MTSCCRTALGTAAVLAGLLTAVAPAAGAPASGSLAIAVRGLPAGVAGDLHVSGPGGFARVVHSAQTLTGLRGGSYRVQPGWVRAARSTFAAADGSFTVRVRAGKRASAVADYAIRVPDSTRVPPPAAVLAVAGDVGSKRVVTLTSAAARGLRIGDVLALGAGKALPAGMLGRVTALHLGDDGMLVTTVPATLAQAVPDGAFSLRRRVALPVPAAASPLSAGALGCGGGVGLSDFKPTGNLAVTVRLAARWHAAGSGSRLDSARFSVAGRQHAAIAPSLLPTLHCGVDETVGQAAAPMPVTVRLGPVPVVITPQVTFDLHADGSANGAFGYSLAQDVNVTAGVGYTRGRFRPLAEAASRFTASPVTVKAKAGLTTALRTKLGLLVDGVAGASVTLATGSALQADPYSVGTAPWWALRGTLSGGAGLELDAWLLPLRWSRPALLASAKVVATAASAGIPTSTTPPSVSDVQGHTPPVVGDTLRADTGAWTNPPARLAYQWQRCQGTACSDVAGATAAQYVLGADDAASALRVTETAGNATGSSSASSAPTAAVRIGGTVVSIGMGQFGACAVQAGGRTVCWGSSDTRGNGTLIQGNGPVVPVSGLADAVSVDGGIWNMCALRQGGSVVCWGHTSSGAGLGNGSTQASTPVAVSGLNDATLLSAGDDAACVLRAGGSALCWGRNGDAELGDGTQTDAPFPVAVSGLQDALSISAGSDHSCAVRANHTVVCWGYNWQGIVGSNPQLLVYATTPVAVAGLSDVTAVDADGYFSCALRSAGNVLCWGDNRYGELGRGAFSNYEYAPAAVSGVTDAVAIAISRYHACALRAGGGVACWGGSDPGQDDAGLPTTPMPLPVNGLTDAKAIAAGGDTTCALRRTGAVVCWGIGDALTPVEVPGL